MGTCGGRNATLAGLARLAAMIGIAHKPRHGRCGLGDLIRHLRLESSIEPSYRVFLPDFSLFWRRSYRVLLVIAAPFGERTNRSSACAGREEGRRSNRSAA